MLRAVDVMPGVRGGSWVRVRRAPRIAAGAALDAERLRGAAVVRACDVCRAPLWRAMVRALC